MYDLNNLVWQPNLDIDDISTQFSCLLYDAARIRPISEVTILVSLAWLEILLLSQLSQTFLTWLHFNKLSLQVTWSLKFSQMFTQTVNKRLKKKNDEIHLSAFKEGTINVLNDKFTLKREMKKKKKL